MGFGIVRNMGYCHVGLKNKKLILARFFFTLFKIRSYAWYNFYCLEFMNLTFYDDDEMKALE